MTGQAAMQGVRRLRAWRARRRRSRMRRVLIIVENCPVPRDRRVWKECSALLGAGFEVSVIAPRGPGQAGREELDGVDVWRYSPARERVGVAGFVLEFAWAWLCTSALTARSFVVDGFAAIQSCNPPDIFFTIAAPYKLAGCHFVFDQHDLSPELYTARYGRRGRGLLCLLLAFERWTYRTADHVIAVNEPQADIARRRGRKRDDQVTLVRNGPTLTETAPRPKRCELKEGKQYLCLWVGEMGAVDDGVDLAVKAAHHVVHVLGRRDCHFAFVGDGEAFVDLTTLAHDLDLQPWVTFTGWADRPAVLDYLATADLGLQPDPKNPRTDLATAVKTLEYLAFGVPVVAFDLDETRRTVGAAGVYATGNDPAGMGALIDELLDDPAARRAMGEHGMMAVRDGLSWDHQSVRYVHVFENLLEQAKREERITR